MNLTPILLPTRLFGRVSVDVHHALNLVITSPTSENLSRAIESVIGIRAASLSPQHPYRLRVFVYSCHGLGWGNVLRIGIAEAAVPAQGSQALLKGCEPTILTAEPGAKRRLRHGRETKK
jgi:hypothetical protein